jgi:L-amino acid N-acyltransferase YncA
MIFETLSPSHAGDFGFSFLRPYNPFPAFQHTAEVSTFIDPEHVRMGLGSAALHRLVLLAFIKNRGLSSAVVFPVSAA